MHRNTITNMKRALEERTYSVLEVNLWPLDLSSIEREITERIRNKTAAALYFVNPHTIVQSMKIDSLRQSLSESINIIDGTGTQLAIRFIYGARASRCAGPEFFMAWLRGKVLSSHRHVLFGGGDTVPDTLQVIAGRYPCCGLVGVVRAPYYPLWALDADETVIAKINSLNADVLWVGIGSPKQELWIWKNRAKINARVLIGIGAAFDFAAGRVARAPRMVQKCGLEWLYRLLQNPKRLWRRNVDSVTFVLCVFRAKVLKELKW